MALNITTDYTIFDNPEAVTVSLIRNGSTTAVSVSAALRGTLNRREQSVLGVSLSGSDSAWFVPDKLLNPASEGRDIREGDTVTAGSEIWKVLAIDTVRMGSSLSGWRVACRKQI